MKHRKYQDFTAQGFNVQALMSLYAGLEKNKDEKPNLTPFVVFLAFSTESYVNSLGARKLEIWDEIERLPWRKKIEILHKVAETTPDWGKEPLQFAAEIFKLRDKLAHGKPERVLEPDSSAGVETSDLKPEWYKGITKEWVLEAKDRFRNLMIYLAALFNYHDSDHLHLSSGGYLTDDEGDT